MPDNPGQTVLWLEKGRLAVRRPGALPFAVELSPVQRGAWWWPASSPIRSTHRGAQGRRKAPFSTSRATTGRSAGGVRAADRRVRFSQGPAAGRRAAAVVGARSRRPPMRSICCRANLPAPRTTARVGTAGAPRPCSRRHCWSCMSARRRCKFVRPSMSRRHSTARCRRSSPPPCRASRCGSAPANAIQARSNSQIRRRAAILSARPENLERRFGARRPKTNINALSYREKALDMTVNAPSLAALSQLSQFVGKAGLAAEIQSSNPIATELRRMFTFAISMRVPRDEQTQGLVCRLQQREQRAVAFGGVILGLIILIGGILLPLQSAVSTRGQGQRNTTRGFGLDARECAARFANAAAIVPADTGEAPVVLVDRVGREAGLGERAARHSAQYVTAGARATGGGAFRHHGHLARYPGPEATGLPSSRSRWIAQPRPDWSMPASRSPSRDIKPPPRAPDAGR